MGVLAWNQRGGKKTKTERGQRLIYWTGMTCVLSLIRLCELCAVTGLSVTCRRISSSAFHSDLLNLRKPNTDIWLSFQKQEQGGAPTCGYHLWEKKASPIAGFRFRSPSSTGRVDGHHPEQTEKGKRITWAEKYTHFSIGVLLLNVWVCLPFS